MSERTFENAVILAGEDLEVVEGYLRIQDGLIEEIGEGAPPEATDDLKGAFVLPPFVNAHTHIGDSVQKDLYLGRGQNEVVGKGGEKFKVLEESSDEEKIEAMRESLSEMKSSGTLAHCDFREGGLGGVRLLARAENKFVKSLILSRPTSEDNIEDLLVESNGVGIPSLDFLAGEKAKRIVEEASKAGKILSFHVSETKADHENSIQITGETEIRRALKFDPDSLIHGTWATREDLKSIKSADVPLVLCPRSNSLLSVGLPPIKQALEEGVELWLGTDNTTVCSPNMFRELSFAWSVLRLQSRGAESREARELLKAATVNPTDDLDLPFGPLEEGNNATFMVLSRGRNLRRCKDPWVGIVNRAGVGNIKTIHIDWAGKFPSLNGR